MKKKVSRELHERETKQKQLDISSISMLHDQDGPLNMFEPAKRSAA
jgi:hypothetical protein